MPHFVVALPLGPLIAGHGFGTADWPLHVTLLPPFAIDADASAVTSALARVTPPRPLSVTAAGDDWFGPRQKTLVTLLEPSDELMFFHEMAVDAVKSLGATFPIPEHLGAGYRPHITVQRTGRVDSGDSVRLDQLAVIDLHPGDGEGARMVRSVLPLTAQ